VFGAHGVRRANGREETGNVARLSITAKLFEINIRALGGAARVFVGAPRRHSSPGAGPQRIAAPTLFFDVAMARYAI